MTMMVEASEAQQACALDCQRANEAHEEGKELAAWKRFGTVSYEDYVGWVLNPR